MVVKRVATPPTTSEGTIVRGLSKTSKSTSRGKPKTSRKQAVGTSRFPRSLTRRSFPTALDIRDDTNDTSLAGMTNNQRKLAQATKIIGASNDPFVVAFAVVSGVAAAVASDASDGLDDVVDNVHKTVAKTGSAVVQDARTGLCDVAEDVGNAGKAAVEPYLQEGEKKKAALKSSYNDAMSMLMLSYLMSHNSNASDVLDYVQSMSSQESTLKLVEKKEKEEGEEEE